MIKFKDELYDLEYSFSRKLLHTEVDTEYYDLYLEPSLEMEEELSLAHKYISSKNEKDLDSLIIGFDIQFERITENKLLLNALKEQEYSVDKSSISSSIYVLNDNGIEVRIANHKRPAYLIEGRASYSEHENELELIVLNNKISKSQLNNLGISKLNSDFYYLD